MRMRTNMRIWGTLGGTGGVPCVEGILGQKPTNPHGKVVL